ncbi:MAG TPA: metallophosphoesterase [Thiobacillus sp.]|nr:metallophosphoesterase [Thiobacillus sp.]
MKIHLLSDIHLEFGKLKLPEVDADVTVLAGDIGVGLQGIEWALQTIPWHRPVIYVMGNHEFYGQRVMMELWKAARKKVEGTHVHLLENEFVVIDGVRILGCTLWTDFCLFGAGEREAAMKAALALNDYWSILTSQSAVRSEHMATLLRPEHTLRMHEVSRDWLDRVLDQPFDGKTVVVTHTAPHRGSLAPKWANDPISPCFVSNLPGLVERADLWIHGHTHDSFDYQVDRCRVICNPRGYVNYREENPGFDAGLVVDLDGGSEIDIGGRRAAVVYDRDIEVYRGEFLEIGVEFYGKDMAEVRLQGAISLRIAEQED